MPHRGEDHGNRVAKSQSCTIAQPEEGLRHGGLGAVVAEVARLSMTASRRLQLAGVGRPRWQLELIRCRAGESADFEVEACDSKGRLALPSNLAHGSAEKDFGRRRASG
jgi:protein ImuA